jgi:DNA-binding transcriptional ArsR family regulator
MRSGRPTEYRDSPRSHVTVPIDITDPKIVKACAHPLRLRILSLLDGRVASPSEISDELGTPLSNTSYHVRQLASLELVELVDRAARRGAIEHYYTATVRPTITNDGWAKLPGIVKRAIIGGGLQQAVAQIAAAAEEGGFDRGDIHYSRTAARLDAVGWQAVSAELGNTLERIDQIVVETEERLANAPPSDAEDATILMMLFEVPEQERAILRGVNPHNKLQFEPRR